MTCDELHKLVHGYIDGELDLVRHLEAEQHLASCPACAGARDNLQLLRAALQGDALRFSPPPELRQRIQTALLELEPSRPIRRRRGWVAVAAVVLIALTIPALLRLRPTLSQDDRLIEEVIACHVRSLMGRHLTDVASSDQHTVKPWFRGRLDFAPTVRDLSGHEFTLDGGRLDYLDHRPVAALIYHRRQHIINLLIWPSPGADEAPQALSRQGYQMIHWRIEGMTYWAISDLNREELHKFAALYQQTHP